MKIIIKLFTLTFAVLSVVFTSCQDDYDPIGNNKPIPTLKVNPMQMAFDGVGGDLSSDLSTNAPSLGIGTPPSWISATLSTDNKKITVKAQANDDLSNIRVGSLDISTKTGENEAVQYLNFVQAAKGGILNYNSFTGKSLDQYWETSGSGAITIGGGYLSMGANTLLVCKSPTALVTQPNNIVIASVDIKAGGEGGLQVYLTNDPNNSFSFFFSINNDTGKGGFYAFHGTGAMALGDAIPGDPLNGTTMPAIPSSAERDDYFRIEFTNSARMPNWWQSVVNIYSLKTTNGVTKVLLKHYTRKFEIDGPKPQPGNFAAWARSGTSSFKNFILSAQKN